MIFDFSNQKHVEINFDVIFEFPYQLILQKTFRFPSNPLFLRNGKT
jgi:hypothetical protein